MPPDGAARRGGWPGIPRTTKRGRQCDTCRVRQPLSGIALIWIMIPHYQCSHGLEGDAWTRLESELRKMELEPWLVAVPRRWQAPTRLEGLFHDASGPPKRFAYR